MRVLRSWLVIAAGVLLCGACFYEAWSSYWSGVVNIPLSRRKTGFTVSVTRADDPIVFFLGVLGFAVIALAILFGLVVLSRRLRSQSSREREFATREVLAPLERAAPSGLAPLWWGIGLAAAAFLLYAAA